MTVGEAGRVLAGMLDALGTSHAFLPDDRPAGSFPDWLSARVAHSRLRGCRSR